MKKFIGSLVACAAIVLVALPSVSFSQGSVKINQERLKRAGAFSAKGNGQAIVRGDGRIHAEGRGTVVVRANRRDDIDVRGFGFKRHEGNLFYFEGRGEISVKGSNISLDITGNVDELRAVGKGTARLIGAGRFHSQGTNGNWAGAGIDVVYGKN